MSRKRKVSLYRLFETGGKRRYVPMVRSGRSWAPKFQPAGIPDSYYLRYRLARERASTPKMANILEKLDYVYPYHRAIGFNMFAAGYSPQDQTHFARMGTKYDFYLCHDLKHPAFDGNWEVIYPRGLRQEVS